MDPVLAPEALGASNFSDNEAGPGEPPKWKANADLSKNPANSKAKFAKGDPVKMNVRGTNGRDTPQRFKIKEGKLDSHGLWTYSLEYRDGSGPYTDKSHGTQYFDQHKISLGK